MGNIYVHRSDDYGKTWPNTSNVIPIGFDVGAVFGVEANSSEVLLFTRGYLGSYDDYQAGIWRSTDGGDNFSLVNYLPMHTPYQGITAVVQLPGTDTIFAMEQAPTVGGGMLWKSNDRGASWGSEVGISAVPDGGFTYGQNIVGFCGNDENRAKGQCRVSFDGGVIWTTYDICDEAIMSARINSFGLLVAATHVHNYPGRYTQGGPRIYYSATLGVTWHQINLDLSYNHYGMLGLDQQCLFLTTEHVCFGSGVGGYVTCANFTTPTSCGNPALIIQDLLNNTRYGQRVRLLHRAGAKPLEQRTHGTTVLP
jgi:hypothetical protein